MREGSGLLIVCVCCCTPPSCSYFLKGAASVGTNASYLKSLANPSNLLSSPSLCLIMCSLSGISQTFWPLSLVWHVEKNIINKEWCGRL